MNATADILARDLARLLTDLVSLNGELVELMKTRLAAIKRADSERITAVNSQEAALLKRIAEREGLRRQLTRKLVEALNVSGLSAQGLRLADLAEYFAEPRRSQLLVAAAGLRERLEEVERLNALSTLVAQEMLRHMTEVLTVMKDAGQRAEVYSRTGQRQRPLPAHVFEAVG